MKKTGKFMALILAAVMTLALGTTVALAATDDTTADAPRTRASSTDSAKPSREKGTKAGGVNVISIAASVLGKTEDEVKEAVKTGKVGDLLVAAGKVDAFKTAYLTEAKTKLDAAVSAGTLTQAQADEKYAEQKAKIDAYDGTTHLCGGADHSKMFERKTKSESTTTGSATATL